jgi:hypothetical protein
MSLSNFTKSVSNEAYVDVIFVRSTGNHHLALTVPVRTNVEQESPCLAFGSTVAQALVASNKSLLIHLFIALVASDKSLLIHLFIILFSCIVLRKMVGKILSQASGA